MSQQRVLALAPGGLFAEAAVLCGTLNLLFRIASRRAPAVAFGNRRFARYFAESPPCHQANPNLEAEIVAVVRAVEKIGTAMPGSTCLTKALAGFAMLRRRGIPASLRFGARRRVGRPLETHAWLVYADRPLIGAEQASTFVPFCR